MTTSSILSELRKHERISPFQTIRIGTIEVYRGMERHGNWSVSNKNVQLAGGRIPAQCDPSTFPIAMAIGILEQMQQRSF